MCNQRFRCFAVFVLCLPLVLAFAPHDDPNGLDSIANSAAPGVGGGGPFVAENIEILSRLSLADLGGGQGNVLGNDCWGWTDPQTDKEYAICGLTNATAFVDISVPTQPICLGRLLTQTGNSAWRDMKVYNDHVFIVSDGNDQHGMQVFDLTQLRNVTPGSPQIFSNSALYTGVGSAHNVAINEQTGFAYIVGSNRASGGLHVVNVQNPTSPVEAGNFSADGYTHDAEIISYSGPDVEHQGQEVAFAANEDSLTIVDVTNKSGMFQISHTVYSQTGYTHQCWMDGNQRYLYLGDELDERDFGGPTRVHMFDCLDLDQPVYLGYYSGETNAVDHNIYIRDDKVFVSNYSAGMRVLQIDPVDPLNLTEIAFVDTYPTDDDPDFDGVWSNYPFYPSGNILVMDRQNGMFIVRLAQLQFAFPNGRPDLIDPDGAAEFVVEVSGFEGTPQPGTGTLHVDRGNGFETFPMNEISPNVYEAEFPPADCATVVSYFVSAMATNGTLTCNPPGAPTTSFTATVADSIATPFTDSFQGDLGWSVTGNASAGIWERGFPSGDGDRGDPTVDGDGSGLCYLTENGPGNTDVDDGSTVLTSPVMDAVGDGTAAASFLNYYRWYSNDVGNSPASDIFVVEISNNNGQTWNMLETVGPAGNEVSGGWIFRSFEISDFVSPTDQMRIRFTASDLGDASVVEAAVDGIEIMLVQCDENQVLLGDVNLDGFINLLDVSPFVALITGGIFQAEADINQDGLVNLLDVSPFVQLLTSN